jgi:hypothetical protein
MGWFDDLDTCVAEIVKNVEKHGEISFHSIKRAAKRRLKVTDRQLQNRLCQEKDIAIAVRVARKALLEEDYDHKEMKILGDLAEVVTCECEPATLMKRRAGRQGSMVVRFCDHKPAG